MSKPCTRVGARIDGRGWFTIAGPPPRNHSRKFCKSSTAAVFSLPKYSGIYIDRIPFQMVIM